MGWRAQVRTVDYFHCHYGQSLHGRNWSPNRGVYTGTFRSGPFSSWGCTAISSVPWRSLHVWLSSSPESPLGEQGKWASPPASLCFAPLAKGAEGRPAQSQLAASHMQAQQVRPKFLLSVLCGCTFSNAASGGSKCSWHKQTAPPSCSWHVVAKIQFEGIKGKHKPHSCWGSCLSWKKPEGMRGSTVLIYSYICAVKLQESSPLGKKKSSSRHLSTRFWKVSFHDWGVWKRGDVKGTEFTHVFSITWTLARWVGW